MHINRIRRLPDTAKTKESAYCVMEDNKIGLTSIIIVLHLFLYIICSVGTVGFTNMFESRMALNSGLGGVSVMLHLPFSLMNKTNKPKLF